MTGLLQTDPDIVLVDSINQLDASGQGKSVIAGSHGGHYPAYKAAVQRARAVILNDAGGALDESGTACLDYCEKIGMAAAVVAHTSARRGDAASMVEAGTISKANAVDRASGCRIGMSCVEAATLLKAAPIAIGEPPPYEETRFVIIDEAPRVICIDSASLVKPEDAGHIVITGSHGGLIGGRREKAFNVDAVLTAFNDAGVGRDQAGIGRLAPLNDRGIAAVTVSHLTARMGDSRSTYNDGKISYANNIARELGASVGAPLKTFVDLARERISL